MNPAPSSDRVLRVVHHRGGHEAEADGRRGGAADRAKDEHVGGEQRRSQGAERAAAPTE